MRTALSNDEAPIDATIETVLPGVHHHLQLHSQQISDVKEDVNTKHELMKTHVSQEVSTAKNDIIQALGTSMMTAGRNILDHTTDGGYSENLNPISRPVEESPRPISASSNLNNPHASIFLKPSYPTLKDLYHHWNGMEGYSDPRFPGGIAVLESTYKAKWRRHFSAAQKKQFSRASTIMRAVTKQFRDRGMEMDLMDILDELEAAYKDTAKSSLGNMITVLQDMGWWDKGKPRGRKRKSDELSDGSD